MKYGIVLIISLFLFMNCGIDETYTVEEIDGVRHVHNISPKWGNESKIKLEFVRKIGDLEGEDENFQFFNPTDVAVGRDGDIYILDSGNCRVQKFNTNGIYMSTFGRRGQGPGEFLDPVFIETISIASQLNILIVDNGKHRIEVFDQNDRYLTSSLQSNNFNSFKLFKNGSIAADTRFLNPNDPSVVKKPLINVFDMNGELIKSFGSSRVFSESPLNTIGNTISSTIDVQDNLYIVFNKQNRIEKYDQKGELVLLADRELIYKESTKIEIVQVESEIRGVYPKAIVNNFSFAVESDSNNRIWIQTYSRQLTNNEISKDRIETIETLTHIEIYDDMGVLLTNIPWEYGKSRILRCIHDNKLYFIDRNNEMAVYIYKIVEM